jgi:FAD/FMN-containing dehydrogenase
MTRASSPLDPRTPRKLTRRDLLARGAATGAALLLSGGCAHLTRPDRRVWVNDVHSCLNRTRVAQFVEPDSDEALGAAIRGARDAGRAVSVCGGRHAMGGQQFGTDTLLVGTDRLAGITELDTQAGQVEVGAGTQWPELIEDLLQRQTGAAAPWTIASKQTGADRLSIGGALAANAHGRSLARPPMVADVEAFTLVDAEGVARRCSRQENTELFRLAIGGYGMFGVMSSVRLRLVPRRKVRRTVEILDLEQFLPAVEQRLADGYLYGDFQYATAVGSDEALRRGVFSCYQPVDPSTPAPNDQRQLGEDDWRELILLAHHDRREGFRRYADYYAGTSGQVYWSDTQQLSTYVDDYHARISGFDAAERKGSEMITEIYVPREALTSFMDEVRRDFEQHAVDLIYGTIRLIERDDETVLAWAREPWACVIFNLHVDHHDAGLARSAADFRRLIDRAMGYGGSYYLTYHRWARREQVLACHPALPHALSRKRHYDPDERFQSDWYRHLRTLLAG